MMASFSPLVTVASGPRKPPPELCGLFLKSLE